MTVKQFTTAAKAAEHDPEAVLGAPITIEMDGREVTFQGATQGQLAVLFAGASDTTSKTQNIASTINFFFSLVEDEDDVRYFKVRLLDRKDAFDADDVADIVMHLVEEWTANPTKQPSDFMPSQKSDGPKSTARQPHKA